MKSYAGIGSRKTPSNILQTMEHIGKILGEQGWTLRSGHADGADKAFEQGAHQAKSSMEIFLPWNGFNGGSIEQENFRIPTGPVAKAAMQLASKYHPAWFRCSPAAKAMHARNCYQVLGADLQTPSQMVICWTAGGKGGGGTGQALRIAKAADIPVFDLAHENALPKLRDFLKENP